MQRMDAKAAAQFLARACERHGGRSALVRREKEGRDHMTIVNHEYRANARSA
jgi:hypothetical protein